MANFLVTKSLVFWQKKVSGKINICFTLINSLCNSASQPISICSFLVLISMHNRRSSGNGEKIGMFYFYINYIN